MIRFLLTASILLVSTAADAQPSMTVYAPMLPAEVTTRPVDRELALAVAKLCANEAGLYRVSPDDCRLIWQVTEGHGETAHERLAWLRAHSSCVLGDEPSEARRRVGNCRWTRNLTWSETRPEGWPPRWSWARARTRWTQVRRLALRLVTGVDPRRPCEIRPDTWGGRVDRERAREHGYRSVRCSGTLNDGYRFPTG